jgi:endonuclease G, mitochondrial
MTMLSNDESVREALAKLLSEREERLGPERDSDVADVLDRVESEFSFRVVEPGIHGTLAEGLSDDTARILEKVVRPEARPALIVSGDSWIDPENQALAERLNRNRQAIAAAIRAVGRIEVRDHPSGFEYVGTGWLFNDDLVVTNQHVASLFAKRAQDGTGFVFLNNPARRKSVRANIDFREEHDAPEQEEIEISRILHIDEDIDVAFLRLAHAPETRDPLQPGIIETPSGAEVAAIGYPMNDPRATPPDWLDLVFGGVFDVKRLMPGLINHATDNLFFHDCSTTGGASGSPLIDTTTGLVVGLHAGAQSGPGGFNFAFPISSVQEVLGRIQT